MCPIYRGTNVKKKTVFLLDGMGEKSQHIIE